MYLKKTNQCYHHTNHEYICLIVQFEDSDSHFFRKDMNWMPKDKEILDLVTEFCQVNPKLITPIINRLRALQKPRLNL